MSSSSHMHDWSIEDVIGSLKSTTGPPTSADVERMIKRARKSAEAGPDARRLSSRTLRGLAVTAAAMTVALGLAGLLLGRTHVVPTGSPPEQKVVTNSPGGPAEPLSHYHSRVSSLDYIRQHTTVVTSTVAAQAALGVRVGVPSQTLGGSLIDMRTDAYLIYQGKRLPADKRILYLFYSNGLVVSEHSEGADYHSDGPFLKSLLSDDTEAEAAHYFNVGGHRAIGWDSGTYVKKRGKGAGVWTLTNSAARLAWWQGNTTVVITMPGKKAADLLPVAESLSSALGR